MMLRNSSSSSKPLVVGVDVGGTKIAAGVVDSQGLVSGRVKIATDTSSTENTLRSIATAIQEAIQAAGAKSDQIAGVGLGIPGMVDPVKGVGLLSTNLKWQNVPVKSWLEVALNIPCTIENDVSAAAVGESQYGVGQGAANLVYLSLGTGIAARAIVEGKLARGSHGLSGEIGHAVFVPNGPTCACGGRGCLEALAAGPAIGRIAQEGLRQGRRSILADAGSAVRAEQVFEAAKQGDELANEVLQETGTHIAYAVHLLAMSYDPQIFVLGGGLALQEGPLVEAIRSGVVHWREQAPVFREVLTLDNLRLTGLQRDGAVQGAAALVAYQQVRGS